MSATAREPRREAVAFRPPRLGAADLSAALKLVNLSLLPLLGAAFALGGWPTYLAADAGLLMIIAIITSVPLLVLAVWNADAPTPMTEVPWACIWFAPWVAVAAWLWAALEGMFELGSSRILLPAGVFCAFVVGLIVLPPGARLQLAAVGNGDVVLGATVVLCAAYVLLWADHLLEHPPPRPGRRAMVALLVLALVLWLVRPLWHGIAMLFIQYPLVTWLPFVLGVLVAVVGGRRPLRRPATCVALALGLALLPALERRALRADIAYETMPTLPRNSQPRMLPKLAAEVYGARENLHRSHLVVDPTTDGLAWSAEERRRLLPFGASEGIGVQPLDRVDGTLERRPGGFETAVSAFGPGTMLWRAAKRHFAIRVQDPVIVPLDDGRAIAIAPYTGYRGFLVRRPYWRGVFVYHQDGRLEDLSPAQAQARPELARSGRLFPEHLARDIAEAHGARVADAPGNPQPYLTNIGDGRTRWITVAHRDGDNDVLGAIYQTDAATGRTTVWLPPRGRRLLSNTGAARVAAGSMVDDGSWPPSVTEPRPAFTDGRLFYLVSIVRHRREITLTDAPPLERTVVVEAGSPG